MAFIPQAQNGPTTDQYIVVAWNDLGMHCANLDFSNMCILPPYNNQKAHVILKGSQSNLPIVMPASSGIYVTYEIPGNTESATKTNFWNYSQHLFGVGLQPNIGLTGFGLTGTMLKSDTCNYHHVEGIPVTAFPDATPTTSTPYQLTLMKAFSSANQLLATTQRVIPVSHEINCVSSGCHSSELSILNEHESVPGYNVANKPILCATCHSDNALGMPGQTGVPSFSQVIHQKHGSETNDCYKCHPGPNTQCFRDVMHTGGMVCQDCHGSVSNVGNTIEAGRNPWLQEPSCGATTCHGYTPAGPGPHGYNPLGIKPVTSNIPGKSEILQNFPNPANFMTNIPYNIATGGKVRLEILNLKGETVTTLMDNMLQPGEYKAEFYTVHFPGGTYLCRLDVNGTVDSHKIVVIK